MNTFHICLIASLLVGYATGSKESHQLPQELEREPTTIWDQFNEELRNATQGTKQFMKYGVKAAVETLKSTITNEIEILYRLHNTEATTVREALLKISELIQKVEVNIVQLECSEKFDEDITAFGTDGLDDLMQRIELLDELLDTLGKVMNTIKPPPNTTTEKTTSTTEKTTRTTTRPGYSTPAVSSLHV